MNTIATGDSKLVIPFKGNAQNNTKRRDNGKISDVFITLPQRACSQ